MPKTLLAVDDSATMRKVLEITFAGEDFRVVTADGPANALAKMSEEPVAVVIDTSLPDGGDGYGLAKEVRARDKSAVILVMSSRYVPYDAARGKDAGVDDYIDKPFDTQALIDKLKKAMVARESGKPAAPPAPVAAAPAAMPAPSHVPAPPPAHAPAPVVQAPAGFGGASPRPPVVAPAAAGARPAFPTQRTHTLSFEGGGTPNPPPVTAPPAHPVPHISRTAPSGVPAFQPPPASSPTAPSVQRVDSHRVAAAAPAAEPPTVVTTVNGALAGKLGDLGLSPAQVEAVLALSREVVERVVWEVVPQLAETMIKEEIARLTKDG